MKGGKSTYMDHLQSVVRQSGGRIVPPELLNRTERPERALYLWNYFTNMSRRRASDGFTGMPLRLTCTEIYSWCQLTRTPLETFEVDLIMELDDALIEAKQVELAARDKAEAAAKKAAPSKKGKA
jgi:hypothetical protein